jgi:hypothetical protein
MIMSAVRVAMMALNEMYLNTLNRMSSDPSGENR